MEGESGLTRSTIDERHFWDIQGGQMEGQSMVLLEVSLMNFTFWMSKEIKWKVKVVLLKVSPMNFLLGISSEMKWKVKVVLLEVSLMNFILRIPKKNK